MSTLIVTFEVIVQTRGWVALGITRGNQGMVGADIFVGWVKGGTTFHQV